MNNDIPASPVISDEEREQMINVYAELLKSNTYKPITSEDFPQLQEKYLYEQNTDAVAECFIAEQIFQTEGIDGLEKRYDALSQKEYVKVMHLSLNSIDKMAVNEVNRYAHTFNAFLVFIMDNTESNTLKDIEYAADRCAALRREEPDLYKLCCILKPEAIKIIKEEGMAGLIVRQWQVFSSFNKRYENFSIHTVGPETFYGDAKRTRDFLADILKKNYVTIETVMMYGREQIANDSVLNSYHDLGSKGDPYNAALLKKILPEVAALAKNGKKGVQEFYDKLFPGGRIIRKNSILPGPNTQNEM